MTKEQFDILVAGLEAGMRPSLSQIKALVAAYKQVGFAAAPQKDAGIQWVHIPPGEVTTEHGRTLRLTEAIEVARTPTTQAQWRAVMGTNPSYHKGDDLPVECVSWLEATEFCAAIGARLLTEEEWEYCCRAGTTGERYDDLDKIAWYYANSDNRTHTVARKAPNAFGLYDMLGNVWEWTATSEGESRVNRGGSYNNNAALVRSAFRFRLGPTDRYGILGFRCARGVK